MMMLGNFIMNVKKCKVKFNGQNFHNSQIKNSVTRCFCKGFITLNTKIFINI